ncbi:MAG: PAS domain S-box protein [Deltaproteobacteria bacterium]|nr:PAS domain S-box protein [Deltaproteobacteria bacterium]
MSRADKSECDSRIEQLERALEETKKALEETVDTYKALTDQLPVGVYRTMTNGRIIQGNPALAKIMGYSLDELADIPAEAVFDDPEQRKIQLNQWKETGGISSNEMRFRTGDGRRIWIRDTGRAVLDERGDVEYLSGIIEDITARRSAEEALREERERLNTILESIGEGVVAIDNRHKVVLANPKAREYLALICSNDWEQDGLSQLGDCSVEEILESPSGDARFHEISVMEPTRRVFEISAHMMRVEIPASGWVLLLRDVTQERGVRQRIDVQQRLAAMGGLAAGVAHDFNNALLVMMSNAELVLRSEGISEKDARRLENIRETGDHAARMIRQIMDFTRQSPAKCRRIDLAGVVEAMATMLSRTMPSGIKMTCNVEPGEYLFEAEVTGIQQVLTNLTLNARDAMPDGGNIVVHLRETHFSLGQALPHPEMFTGRWAVIEIADTGSGIPPEVVPSIFEPFFTTKEPNKGTGLGLAQVYGIIKRHDGYVAVKTEINKGTTFTIYLHLEMKNTG